MLDLRDFGYQRKYSDEYITHLIDNLAYVPIASGAELNALRNATTQKMGAETQWEGDYATGIDKKYIQVRNISLIDYQAGTGWVPIPTSDANFVIDGNMLITKECKINDSATGYKGLFGGVSSGSYNQGQYKNMILDDFDISGGIGTAGLVALGRISLIENCHLINSKIVGSTDSVGGLTASPRTGGTIRYNSVQNCEITSGRDYAGAIYALAYFDADGTLAVTQNFSFNNKITAVRNNAGGFDGGNQLINNSRVINSTNNYSLFNNVMGESYVAGYTARVNSTGTRSNIINCFSNSKVTGTSNTGGLVGANSGTITNSYYDSQTSGQSDTGKGLPRTTLQMLNGTANSFILPNGDIDPDSLADNAMYTAWDETIWRFFNNKYPKIKRT